MKAAEMAVDSATLIVIDDKTLALLGGHICKSPEEYKAWSQNLGHEDVLTTFSSYGEIERHRQGEIIRALGTSEQRAE